MIVDPKTLEWGAKPDVQILLNARTGVPEAVAEHERRGLDQPAVDAPLLDPQWPDEESCVIEPETLDWSQEDDYMVTMGALSGYDAAMDEATRRGLDLDE